jgi:lambda family phage portal protein
MARPNLQGKTRLDRLIAYVSPERAARRQRARLQFELASQFRGAETTRLLQDWVTESLGIVNPPPWELGKLRERSQELNRNNPIASGITDTLVTNVIGPGLQPQSRLRAKELGISDEEAQFLRRQAENVFDTWQKRADASGRQNFSGLQALAFRKVVEDGEILSNLPMIKEPGRSLQRAVELIVADRLGSPFGKEGVFDGVELGEDRKEPQKYWIRKANITTNNYEMRRYDWVGMPARDSRGRPLILHNYLLKNPGQIRGIPFFAPALTYFKHTGDYMSAAVVTAKMAAFISLVIVQSDPNQGLPQNPSGAGDQKKEIWEPGSLLHLKPGETAQLLDPKGIGENFGKVMETGLRILGANSGLPYELLLKDFSKTNYSSARAALLEARRWFMFLRTWFGQEFSQPIWELVLEEAYLRGRFQAKNFYQFQEEYCRAQWIGGGWGWVDPVKEIAATIAAILAGLSTYADELAGQGKDWEDVFEQLVQEKQYAKTLGLIFVAPKTASAQGELSESQGSDGPATGQARRDKLAQILGFLAQISASSREGD